MLRPIILSAAAALALIGGTLSQAQAQTVLRGGVSVGVPWSPYGGNTTRRTGTNNPGTGRRDMSFTTPGAVRMYGRPYVDMLQNQGAAGASRAQILRAESEQRYREAQRCVQARGTNCQPQTPLTGGGVLLQRRPLGEHTYPGHIEALRDDRRYLYGPTRGGTNPGAPFRFNQRYSR